MRVAVIAANSSAAIVGALYARWHDARAEMLGFTEGPLRPAICAGNAFPGLFAPVEHEGRFLLDGGILNDFPVDLIRAMTSRPILAVDVWPGTSKP